MHVPHQVDEILKALGLDLDDENFKDTSVRWTKYMKSYLQPYTPQLDLEKAVYENVRSEYSHAMVVQAGIPYRAMCAHHLLPVLGTAHVAYIPREKVVGLSKLSRLVYGISHRLPSLQEHVGNEIVDALMQHLKPLGAMCVISAEHGCMAARGVEEATGQIKTVTSSIRGVFIEKHETRAEFYSLVGM